LEIPEGYRTEFQFFYGYQVDQIRNLIAEWAQRYDYLFAVDSDIIFKPDTLKRLLAHNKAIVSGLYIQRKPGQHILELYKNGRNIPYNEIRGLGLIEVDSCGFGCVLVHSNVFKDMGYPHFVYRSALNHDNTISEDTYFCLKANGFGYKVFADTAVLCEHIGSTKFIVDANPIKTPFERLLELANTRLLPTVHVEYLAKMKQDGHEPKVVYDIGACVLHWTREAVNIWPESKYFAFEAMEESAQIFDYFKVPHAIGLLSDEDGRELEFWQNTEHPGGNSYYKENEEINPNTVNYFDDTKIRKVKALTLDTMIEQKGFPLPDLIKMDVQGAELDILKGASKCLANAKDVILELQKVEYNKGAPLRDEVILYMGLVGFYLKEGPFCDNGPDGDYHFTRA
jgi:FkbM family methyltransferase